MKINESMTTIKRVLSEEAQAITKLIDEVDENYINVVELLSSCKGKIILTGMGKSGHVARKISATMASLGTPSFFLHPGEAAHGDLGMVERDDVVIMVSRSGETDELIQLLNSLKIIGCRLVGLFCEKNSTLEKQCEMTIVLPVEKEACINNLAPTTSTTLTMAVGDALAVALSQKKNFDKQNFAVFHPMGTLGKQLLLLVDNIANKDLEQIAVKEDEDIKKVLWKITQNRLGAVGVVDKDGMLIGLVADGDIRRGLEKNDNILNSKVKDVMTSRPISIDKGTLAVEAFKMMQEKKISVLPITEGNQKLCGIVSFHSLVELGISGGK